MSARLRSGNTGEAAFVLDSGITARLRRENPLDLAAFSNAAYLSAATVEWRVVVYLLVDGGSMGETVGQIRVRARRDAASVLASHWPTRTVPVDPIFVARSLGVDVFTAQLGTDTFGMLVGDAGKATIYLDQDQPPARMRFTCAHEVGHYIDRGNDLLDGMAFVDRRSDEGRGTADEIYANEFAASLLMPDNELRSAVGQMNDIGAAAHFGVSLDALRYRRQLLRV